MKKLAAVLLMLTIAGICSPSYGYFLIYRMSAPVKGVDGAKGKAQTIPLKTYMVLDIDDINESLRDANLIMYGKDSKNKKVYVELNISDSDKFTDGVKWQMGDYLFVDFWTSDDSNNPFWFEGLAFGRRKERDIGLGEKYYVAGSLKGAFMVWGFMLLDADQDIAGTCNISASLWSQKTLVANFDMKTKKQIVDELITILEGQRYSPAILPTHP